MCRKSSSCTHFLIVRYFSVFHEMHAINCAAFPFLPPCIRFGSRDYRASLSPSRRSFHISRDSTRSLPGCCSPTETVRDLISPGRRTTAGPTEGLVRPSRLDGSRFPRSGQRSQLYMEMFLETCDGCDHTSTNAPDPIRTPQLSVLGRE